MKPDVHGKKVAVGLSGGVDSAVAAALLKEQGYDVTGVYLQCWDFSYPGCRGDADRADAAGVAAQLGIGFTHLDFIDPYREQVLEYFYNSYEKGLTPNPDILCNTVIKFGLFLDWALSNGFDFIGTGHYVRVEKRDTCVGLFSGLDTSKDQSYFLYGLNQDQLEHALLPLGGLIKEDVRRMAKDRGLSVYKKPDSTGICFIGDVDVREFLETRLAPKEGPVVLQDGTEVGRHTGAWFYTVGQRRGFEITEYVGIPLYVVEKDVVENKLVVGPIKEAYKSRFSVGDPHWICGLPDFPLRARVRVRNLGEFYSAEVVPDPSGGLYVTSERGIFGVAPGQSAVFYKDSQVLGGGIIR